MATRIAKRQMYRVQSLDRAFEILQCFSLRKQELDLNEICEQTQLPKPTVFRLLSSLQQARFVERTTDGQKYQVGVRAFELGGIFLAHLSIESVARPLMERLTEQRGMTCNLAILDDGQVVYIATTDPLGPLHYHSIVGYRHYIHCSALGKALVAELSPEEVKHILRRRGMPALSPNTITDPDVLLSELAKTRKQGYAIDNQEGAVGFCCLGVPIRNHTHRIVAAISVSAASPQMTPDTRPAIARDLQATAREISKQLGWSEQPA